MYYEAQENSRLTLVDAPQPCLSRAVLYSSDGIEVCMATPGCSPLVLRFDVFEVDLRACELYKAGRKIKLQVLPFQTLALLLERPGEIVRREELRKKLWSTD